MALQSVTKLGAINANLTTENVKLRLENGQLKVDLAKYEEAAPELHSSGPLDPQQQSFNQLRTEVASGRQQLRELKAQKEADNLLIKRLQSEVTSLRESIRTPFEIDAMKKEKAELESSLKQKNKELAQFKLECAEGQEDRYKQLLDDHEKLAAGANYTAHLDLQEAKKEIKELTERVAIYEDCTDGEIEPPRTKSWKNRVPDMFVNTSYSALKRKVEEDLYTGGEQRETKRLKVSQVMAFPGLGSPSLEGVTNFIFIAQNEVLRVAAKGGLINPIHFEVTPRGIIGITQLGMDRIDLQHKYRSEPKMVENWNTENGAKHSSHVRDIIIDHEFANYAHPSMRPLADTLVHRGKDMTMESLSDHLVAIEGYTKDDVGKLDSYISHIKNRSVRGRGQPVDKKGLTEVLQRLTMSHDNATSSAYVRMMMKDVDSVRMVYSFQLPIEKVFEGYRKLYAAKGKVAESMKIPRHYFAPAAPRIQE